MKIAITGHRPNKLWGYEMEAPKYLELKRILKGILIQRKTTLAISGMALGVDTVYAQAALEAGVPLEAAIPCRGHSSRWPSNSKRSYEEILRKAHKVTLVSDLPYTPYLMQVRNEYMVNNCDLLIAVWDGSPGGTGNCVKYARAIGREILLVDPREIKERRESVAPSPYKFNVKIWTSGSSSNNQDKTTRIGEFAYIMSLKRPSDGSLKEKVGSGQVPGATNIAMDLRAVLEALKGMKREALSSCCVEIYTNSMHVINVFQGACEGEVPWLDTWKNKGWLNSKRQPIKEKEIIQEIEELLSLCGKWEFHHFSGGEGDWRTVMSEGLRPKL